MRFAEFYPRYLAEHSNRTCRRLHFLGTTLGLIAALHAFSTLNFWWIAAGLPHDTTMDQVEHKPDAALEGLIRDELDLPPGE